MGQTTKQKATKAAHLMAAVSLVVVLAIPSLAQSAQQSTADRVKRVVLVSIPDRKLAVLDGGQVVARFPVAVGAAISPSPTGEFQIVNRISDPAYYHAGKVIPAGKDNPLGTRWLGLSQNGYGIHGTNVAGSIGHAASHGCIRLRNRDIERLFPMLRVGDTVVIRAERNEQTAEIFGRQGTDTESRGFSCSATDTRKLTKPILKKGAHHANGNHIHGGRSRNVLFSGNRTSGRGTDLRASLPFVLCFEFGFKPGLELCFERGFQSRPADGSGETVADAIRAEN
jgi:L,D-transpeptidase ErfK/SrfK